MFFNIKTLRRYATRSSFMELCNSICVCVCVQSTNFPGYIYDWAVPKHALKMKVLPRIKFLRYPNHRRTASCEYGAMWGGGRLALKQVTPASPTPLSASPHPPQQCNYALGQDNGAAFKNEPQFLETMQQQQLRLQACHCPMLISPITVHCWFLTPRCYYKGGGVEGGPGTFLNMICWSTVRQTSGYIGNQPGPSPARVSTVINSRVQ